jgi:hypothetical protein
MNLFKPFRSRSASRDDDTDRQRFDRLSAAIASLREQIVQERDGLRRRYEQRRDDAAFAFDALDRKPSSARLADELDRQSAALLSSEKRLKTLDQQRDFIDRIDVLLGELRTGNKTPTLDD